MTWPTSEEQLGPPVIAWLERDGWDVYQEVVAGCGRADLVARRGRLLLVVEMKRTLGLDVIRQARNWIGWAHLVYVAVPASRRPSSDRRFVHEVLAWAGAGLVEASELGASKRLDAPLHRRPPCADRLRELLVPQQKTFAVAGNARGEYWTSFKGTVRELVDVVAREPGIPLKDALARIKHHYRTEKSAIACIAAHVDNGVIDDVDLRRDGKALRLYPKARAA